MIINGKRVTPDPEKVRAFKEKIEKEPWYQEHLKAVEKLREDARKLVADMKANVLSITDVKLRYSAGKDFLWKDWDEFWNHPENQHLKPKPKKNFWERLFG